MFSELVDRAVHIAGRPDSLEDIAYSANETMRDISKRNDWDDDACEEIVAVTEPQTIWDPEVGRSRFRREEYIEDGCGCSPLRTRPSSRMRSHVGALYYRSGPTFIFSNVCDPLMIFYWAYQPWLEYYKNGDRPAVFDVKANDWGGATEADIDLVSNWMLERHNNVVLSGTLANFFKAKSDERQRTHFAAYEQGISHMVRGESARQLLARR